LNAHLPYLPDESRVNHWRSAWDGRLPFLAVAPVLVAVVPAVTPMLAVAPVLARRRLSGAGY